MNAGDFGSAVLEDAGVQSALERTREAAAALPAGEEKTANDFMRFSHLWTRPLSEALQVCHFLGIIFGRPSRIAAM